MNTYLSSFFFNIQENPWNSNGVLAVPFPSLHCSDFIQFEGQWSWDQNISAAIPIVKICDLFALLIWLGTFLSSQWHFRAHFIWNVEFPVTDGFLSQNATASVGSCWVSITGSGCLKPNSIPRNICCTRETPGVQDLNFSTAPWLNRSVMARKMPYKYRVIEPELRLWKFSKIMLSPTMTPGPLCWPLNHIPRCHIHTFFRYFQELWLHNCPGQFFQCLTTLSVKEFSPISNLNLSGTTSGHFLSSWQFLTGRRAQPPEF